VQVLVFPELGLTGYLLQDLNAEVAMAADDERLAELASAAGEMSTVVGFVEEGADHRLFISAALLEGGAVASVTRKAFLPNYGMFDERRFFAPGERVEAVDSRLGLRLGICICEDFWHMPVPLLLALDGAQLLVNISSSPGRDVAARVESGLGTADSWRALFRTYAMLTTTPIVYVNRVGVEESITFWGGSEVVDAAGESVFRAPLHDEGLFVAELDLDETRRQRVSLPLLRDERPELIESQLERIARTRAGVPEPFERGNE
jgi:predicted amidohydrolase